MCPLGQFMAFGGIGILNGGEPFVWSSRRLFCCADTRWRSLLMTDPLIMAPLPPNTLPVCLVS